MIDLPLVDAGLNATSTVLLVSGLVAIKRGERKLHERLMYSAFAASLAFLACYLWYHFVVIPKLGVTKFNATGALKVFYLGMLLSHVLLAIVNVPLCIVTFAHARAERWERHKRWAKVTFPVWLYVSVTGVLVYLFLYVWNPPAAIGTAGGG
jgi:uncharacterized membrane protein YozB (DUF420 family)